MDVLSSYNIPQKLRLWIESCVADGRTERSIVSNKFGKRKTVGSLPMNIRSNISYEIQTLGYSFVNSY